MSTVGVAALGGGKYGEETTAFRVATGARVVICIVLEGHRGNGFVVQMLDPDDPAHTTITRGLPDVLRQLATEIELTMQGV